MRTSRFAAGLLLIFASRVWCQWLYFGVIGGTNITNNFPVTDVSTPADAYGNPANRFQFLTGPRKFIAGALVGGRLSETFSIEANVLRRPMTSTVIFSEFLPTGATRTFKNVYTEVDAWEFPLLLKYSLPWPRTESRFRPFIEAGPSFRTQENAGAVEPSQFGVSIGAGLAYHVAKIRVAPELRYTRWKREFVAPKYATKPDQLEFLTSISYETDASSWHLGGRRLAIGAVVGVPLMHRFGPMYGEQPAERFGYLAGIKGEINATRDLSVEVNVIYKPLRAGLDNFNGYSVLTWQFPVLAKYVWGTSRWRPLAEAGPSFRLAGNLNGYNPSHLGATAGAGIETRARGVLLSPVLRYTRWAGDPSLWRLPPGAHYDYFRTNPNSVELILGISF